EREAGLDLRGLLLGGGAPVAAVGLDLLGAEGLLMVGKGEPLGDLAADRVGPGPEVLPEGDPRERSLDPGRGRAMRPARGGRRGAGAPGRTAVVLVHDNLPIEIRPPGYEGSVVGGIVPGQGGLYYDSAGQARAREGPRMPTSTRSTEVAA